MSNNPVESIRETLLSCVDESVKIAFIHRQKDYLTFRKDLWIRYGGSLPLPESNDYTVVEESKVIKVMPNLSKVAVHLLKTDFFVHHQEDSEVSPLNIYSSSTAPLTQARVQAAKEVMDRLGSSLKKSLHVEPVLNSHRRVHELSLEEALESMDHLEEYKCDTFGGLVKNLPSGELTFKLLSCSLSKSVVLTSNYSTKFTFILYNAARIKQILESYVDAFGSFPLEKDVNFDCLSEEGTLIISYISNYHALLDEIRREGTLHRLPLFLTGFIGEFSRYYRNTRVLRESPHLRESMDAKVHFLRFVLCFLHHTLSLLGITCLKPWTHQFCQIYLTNVS